MSRLAAHPVTPPQRVSDPWLQEWHARRAVRRRDEQIVRRVDHAARVSFLIGPTLSGVAIYLVLREIVGLLVGRIVLP